MKTKRITKKAKNLVHLVIVGSLFLSTTLVSGTDGNIKKNLKKHEVKSSAKQLETKIEVSYDSIMSEQENYVEDEEMDIEDWMLRLNEFYEQETDEEMAIENWMADVHHPFWKDVREAAFKELALEK